MKNWENKRVVVAGGSQGLGLEIAKSFGIRGAEIVLIARDSSKLATACETLSELGITVNSYVCDATDWESVKATFEQIQDNQGWINVLVNAVGKSTRSDIEAMDLQEAREMMEVNYFSAFHCIKAGLSNLKNTMGSIVNIGSLSSKTAWPFMTPYTASKFALAALTHQLRIEMGDRIHAMLVCPGPLKREDAGQRYDRESEGLPDSARKPGGGAKLKGVCTEKLANKIVRGCEKKKSEIIMPWKSNLLFIASSLSTRLGDWLIRMNKS